MLKAYMHGHWSGKKNHAGHVTKNILKYGPNFKIFILSFDQIFYR